MGPARAALMALVVATSCATSGAAVSPTPMLPNGCRAGTPLAHVYSPDRLKVLDPCKHAEGVVVDVAAEEDGDYHVWFAPDPAYAYLMNPENHFQGRPAMLAEIVPDCTGQPADEQAAARCPKTRIAVPKLHDHVAMNGPWVFDTNHGWNEIHPVDTISVLGHA
jgi:hypothetical protein